MLNYAENIKRIRKMKNITQSELAKGIASQGMISKVEKKQISPDIDLLEAIAKKLECSLMDLLLDKDGNNLEQMYSYMNGLVSRREYHLLEQFFKSDPSIVTIKKENESYYRWINGVILTQNYTKYDEGIIEMKEALNLTSNSQLKMRILIGLSGLYSEIDKFDESLRYLLETLELSEQVEIDYKLKQKTNFQLARLYSVMEQFNESIFYNRIAIQFSVEKDSLYLLDDLYLLLADSYLRLGEVNKANNNVLLAKTVAEIRSNTKLIPYIERTQYKIENRLKNE